MTIKIQFMAWDRHKKVVGLNWFMMHICITMHFFCIVLWRNLLLLSLFWLSHFLELSLHHRGSGCPVHVAVNNVLDCTTSQDQLFLG